ncbi:MAG: hypothetical protein QM490_02095 [Candidatus Gracilibacteria bacterium]
MLLELEKYGIKEGYFIKNKLKNFSEAKKDGFYHIKHEAINFDETGKQIKTHSYKTADALIFKTKKKLKFIEFKGLKNNSNIAKFIEGLHLDLKVQDSFSILRNILNEKKFGTKYNRKNFNETKNHFIFSISCNNLDPTLEFLLTSSIAGFEDYDITLEKVFWVETKDIEKYL